MFSKKITSEIRDRIIHDFEPLKAENKNEYVIFYANDGTTSITIFENKKKENTLVIAGKEEKEIALNYYPNEKFIKKEKNNQVLQGFMNSETQIGSDEVGFGDFFGPIVVVAAYCDSKTLKIIEQFGIEDSKKMNDENIKIIVPKIIKKITFSSITVENEKLNSLFEQGLNLNQIKSILHNTVLYNVSIKKPAVRNFFIDKFTPEAKYFEYIKNQKNVIKNIVFECKGESKFPSVALASVIARYVFITYMDKLSKKYSLKIPFGASGIVDKFAKKFIETYGIGEFNKNVKKNFKNYKEITEENQDI